jgi:hypothetical protein
LPVLTSMLRHQTRRIETILQSQTPVIQMLNEISATMVTKREFIGHRRMPRICAPMKPRVKGMKGSGGGELRHLASSPGGGESIRSCHTLVRVNTV